MKLPFNYQLFLTACQQQGTKLNTIGQTDIFLAQSPKRRILITDIASPDTPFTSGWLASDKFFTKKMLERQGIKVPPGQVFDITKPEIAKALKLAKKLEFPVVVKAVTLGQGELVFTHLMNRAEVISAIEKIKKTQSVFLLEKHIFGPEFRLFCTLKGKFAAVNRIPANVVGQNGLTIRELIAQKNYDRTHPRNSCLCTIRIDETLLNNLEIQGLTLNTVVPKNAMISLRYESNVSLGADCVDITDKVHTSFKALAQSVLQAFPGLTYAGIDLICQDISKPLTSQSYAICELNVLPGLSLHALPGSGRTRPVDSWLATEIFA